MEIIDRMKSPTPKFWKKVRGVMIGIGTISGIIIGMPIAIPVGLVTLATYGLAIGATGTILAQTTKEDKK